MSVKEVKGKPAKGERTVGAVRKKGTPNKKTRELMETLEKLDFDPATALVHCYRQAQIIFNYRKKKMHLSGALVALSQMESTAAELAQFVFPKKRAIEHSGELGVRTFSDFIAAGESDEDGPID